jgi:hypothetical protein
VKRTDYVVTGALLLVHESSADTREQIQRAYAYPRIPRSLLSLRGLSPPGIGLPSGSSVMCSPVDFPDETGLYVKNKTPHGNFFGDPRM